jgi:hypothetical protein
MVNVETDELFSVEWYDCTGRLQQRATDVLNGQLLDIQKLAPGFYHVKIRAQGVLFAGKMLKI